MDFSRPGLVVDLSRRVHLEDLAKCFQTVQAGPWVNRGAENGPAAPYKVLIVSGPRLKVLKDGCWKTKAIDH